MILVIIAAAVCITGAAYVGWRHRRSLQRQRSLRRLLDAADDMEQLLLRTRSRMQAMQGVIGRVPEDIGARARASLQSDRQIQDALRDVLEHRLWIKKHGDGATRAELDAAGDALDRARSRIGDELSQLERTGAALNQATAQAERAAAREPPALRRRAQD